MSRIGFILRIAILCGGIASIVGFGEALIASILGQVPYSVSNAINWTLLNYWATVTAFLTLWWVGRAQQKKEARKHAKSKPGQSGDLAEL